METAYDSSCAADCIGEELDEECDNFDPANGIKTATHLGAGDPVCLTASSDPPGLPPDALAAGFFGQVSECEPGPGSVLDPVASKRPFVLLNQPSTSDDGETTDRHQRQ